jgi:hypothetical protein
LRELDLKDIADSRPDSFSCKEDVLGFMYAVFLCEEYLGSVSRLDFSTTVLDPGLRGQEYEHGRTPSPISLYQLIRWRKREQRPW